jgi:uncharacterized protein YjbI with pentapeptide repeats
MWKSSIIFLMSNLILYLSKLRYSSLSNLILYLLKLRYSSLSNLILYLSKLRYSSLSNLILYLLKLRYSSLSNLILIFVLTLWCSCSHRYKLVGFQISWKWADDGYSRNASFVLNLISTFLWSQNQPYKRLIYTTKRNLFRFIQRNLKASTGPTFVFRIDKCLI